MRTQKNIGDLLGELRSEGSLDSHGSFTIDPEKARSKFRQFGFQEPHHYACVLVSALIGGGASFVEVECDSNEFRLISDFLCTATELERLYALASAHDSHHFFKLAVGLETSFAIRPRRVQMEVWDGQQGAVLVVHPSKIEVTTLEESPWASCEFVGSRIRISEGLGLRIASKLFSRFLKKESIPEEALLRRRCFHSPVPIRVQGRRIDIVPSLQPNLAYLRLIDPKLGQKVHPDVKGKPLTLEMPCEGFEAHIALNHQPRAYQVAELVVSGLALEGWTMKLPGQALVYCDHISTDLSMEYRVQDSEHNRIRDFIEQAARQAIVELYSGPLLEQPIFDTHLGPLSYEALNESYQKHGFLTVVSERYSCPPYADAPLVKLGNWHLELLFPEQARDQEIG